MLSIVEITIIMLKLVLESKKLDNYFIYFYLRLPKLGEGFIKSKDIEHFGISMIER
jgi:hypothetical protein